MGRPRWSAASPSSLCPHHERGMSDRDLIPHGPGLSLFATIPIPQIAELAPTPRASGDERQMPAANLPFPRLAGVLGFPLEDR